MPALHLVAGKTTSMQADAANGRRTQDYELIARELQAPSRVREESPIACR